MHVPPRPPFRPFTPSSSPLSRSSSSETWTPLLSHPAHFPSPTFTHLLASLLEKPEYNSSLILRADVLPLPDTEPPLPASLEQFDGFRPVRRSRRRLVPRRPDRDGAVVQECVVYRRYGEDEDGLLVMRPLLGEDEKVPYYHPDVQRIAFLYTEDLPFPTDYTPPDPPSEDEDALSAWPVLGTLHVLAVLPHSTPLPLDPSSRLVRTANSLLTLLHTHGCGHVTGYRKRVVHDVLVQKEHFQDLYLALKARHRSHTASWPLSTNPLKHVFEVKKNELDIAIAAFLMLLWRLDYPALSLSSLPLLSNPPDAGTDTPEWSTWGRPPGGFVDLGCGNGLLVHILLSEGYTGCGLDLLPRPTWPTFPSSTSSNLHSTTLDPLAAEQPLIPGGAFLIGNHADELTPWIPVLSTLHAASGWIAIPCCPFLLSGERFTRHSYTSPLGAGEVDTRVPGGQGGDGEGMGTVKSYLVWVEEVGRRAGWEVGLEALRLPSTRSWALVGRNRAVKDGDSGGGSEDEGKEWAEEQVRIVTEKGGWRVRPGKRH